MDGSTGGGNSPNTSHRKALTTIAILLLVILVPASLSPTSAATASILRDEWVFPDIHHINLKGEDSNNVYLTREAITDAQPTGMRRFSATSGGNIIEAVSTPTVDSLNTTVNITVRLFASLDPPNTAACNYLGEAGKTSFVVTLSAGERTLLDGVETDRQMLTASDWSEAQEFTTPVINTELKLSEGDFFELQVSPNHICGQASLWWGGFDTDSGIDIEGDILEPIIEVTVDRNRLPRIDMTPLGPWGEGDYGWKILDIWGPFDELEDAYPGVRNEDQHIDHFEAPHGTRLVEGNRTALIWSGNIQMPPGYQMLLCQFETVDGQMIEALLVFEVEDLDSRGIQAGWALLTTLTLISLGWIAFTLKKGLVSWPLMIAILLLGIATAPMTWDLPSISSESERIGGPVPSFVLLKHGGGSISLSELLDGKDAVVIGTFEPGSPNAAHQAGDFLNASDTMGDRIAFVQIATGESVRSVDLDSHHAHLNAINATWPLLIDEVNGGVSSQLPTGMSDGVVMVDGAGFAAWWKSGAASPTAIESALDGLTTGSGHEVLDLVRNWLILLPLVLLALPREQDKAPEDGLVPGSSLFVTTLAGAFGFVLLAIPILTLVLTPLDGQGWWLVELLMGVLLLSQAIRFMLKGKLSEINFIVSRIYNKLPSSIQEWRTVERFTQDVMLGIWIGWLAWLIEPMLIPQGIGSTMVSGIEGLFLAPILLIFLSLLAGVEVLVLRGVAWILGPLSLVLGRAFGPELERLWGLLLTPIAAWIIIWTLISILNNGVAL